MYSDEELCAARDHAVELLLSRPEVNAVGIGGRERGGRPTGEIMLRVYLEQKKPRYDVPPEELIPAEIDGVPTDVAELGRGELLQTGPPVREWPPVAKPTLPDRRADRRRCRPLSGGSRLQVELFASGAGTLGCFLEHKTDTSKRYALTNWHVLQGESQDPTPGRTRAGQPNSDDSITKCCSNLIGTVAGGGLDINRDEGVVELAPGMEWRPEITDIGPVRDVHAITTAEAGTHAYPVRKRGMRSQLTGGTVDAIGVAVRDAGLEKNNVTLIKFNPDPLLPASTQLWFAQPGDSGSALVNDKNEIVGLVFAIVTSGPHIGWAYALPIEGILGRLESVDHLPLKVATATDTPAPVHTVSGTAKVVVPQELAPVLSGDTRQAAPATTAWLPGVAPPTFAALARLQADLDRSEAGRLLVELWLGHQGELIELLDRDRRTAAAWHRAGGPALLQTLVRMMDRPALTLPETVHDVPLPMLLERLHDLFAARASTGLRSHLARVKAALPDLSGLTYPQAIARLSAVEVR